MSKKVATDIILRYFPSKHTFYYGGFRESESENGLQKASSSAAWLLIIVVKRAKACIAGLLKPPAAHRTGRTAVSVPPRTSASPRPSFRSLRWPRHQS
eukprot:scaffold93657_cov36-Prasinocladus_malaysianus.AAC.1